MGNQEDSQGTVGVRASARQRRRLGVEGVYDRQIDVKKASILAFGESEEPRSWEEEGEFRRGGCSINNRWVIDEGP